jgi:hypothetical protein
MSDAPQETPITANPPRVGSEVDAAQPSHPSGQPPAASRGTALAVFGLMTLACGLGIGHLLFGGAVPAGNADKPSGVQPKDDDGEITLTINSPERATDVVSVTLFRDAKRVATKEVRPIDFPSPPGAKMQFMKLPLGTYEARLECVGCVTMVKTIVLREADKRQAVHATLTKGEGAIIFGGPSLQELDTRLKKLEVAFIKLKPK